MKENLAIFKPDYLPNDKVDNLLKANGYKPIHSLDYDEYDSLKSLLIIKSESSEADSPKTPEHLIPAIKYLNHLKHYSINGENVMALSTLIELLTTFSRIHGDLPVFKYNEVHGVEEITSLRVENVEIMSKWWECYSGIRLLI